MNSNNFFSALPNFVSGVHSLQQALTSAALVIAFAGLVFHVIQAFRGRDTTGLFSSLVRLALIPIIILGLQTWGDMLQGVVQELTTDVGSTNGGNVFQAYQNAITLKLGTATATQNFAQNPASAAPGQAVPSPLPGPGIQTAGSGIKLTAYGYPGDLTPDSNSKRGIGAFDFSSTPGSLIPGYSTALSATVAQQYGISPGQSFTVTTTTGQSYNLVYADVVPASFVDSNGNTIQEGPRIDIYDPNQQLSSNDNNFGQSVSSVSPGSVVQGQGLNPIAPTPSGSIGDQVLWAITLGLSWIASAIMYLMTIAQQLLYMIEIAISPAFIACLMIPALTPLARRFFLTLVGISLWPLGWSICNLVTIALINMAVNPSGNSGLATAGAGAAVTGPLAGVAYLLVIAVWVIGSTLAAPLFITALLGANGGATAAVFGATLGAAGVAAARSAAPHAASAATNVISSIGNGSGYSNPPTPSGRGSSRRFP
jgi:hypothetical protein